MTTNMSATDRLEELRQAAADVGERLRDLEDRAREAQGEPQRVRQAVTDAYARGDEAEGDRLGKTLPGIEKRAAEPWNERVQGARRAHLAARGQVQGFIEERRDELLEERRPLAEEAAANLEHAIEGVVTAIQQWHVEDQAAAGFADPKHFMSAYGRGIDELYRQAKRVLLEGVPVPTRTRRPTAPVMAPLGERG